MTSQLFIAMIPIDCKITFVYFFSNKNDDEFYFRGPLINEKFVCQ